MTSNKKKTQCVSTRFGFSTQRGSHNARTIMLDELKTLLDYVNNPASPQETYIEAIKQNNCLNKRSGKTRELTARHLVALYGLNPKLTILRALLYLWFRDPEAQPILSLLCSYSRDSIIRLSAPHILATPEGGLVNTANMVVFIENKMPGSYSDTTLKSTSQNINSSWTKSGYLAGRAKKSSCKTSPDTRCRGICFVSWVLKRCSG